MVEGSARADEAAERLARAARRSYWEAVYRFVAPQEEEEEGRDGHCPARGTSAATTRGLLQRAEGDRGPTQEEPVAGAEASAEERGDALLRLVELKLLTEWDRANAGLRPGPFSHREVGHRGGVPEAAGKITAE